MTLQTTLQQSRDRQEGAINASAAETYDVIPGQGNNVPGVFQMQKFYEQMMAEKNNYPIVNPPSEEEIQKTMWISSGLLSLVGALVSGNAAGGIACGMTAALAIHDHGYTLRERGDYVHDLHERGFSAPAILHWYKTGDNSQLDKESDRMQKMAEGEVKAEQNNRDYDEKVREFGAGQELKKKEMANQWGIAAMHERGADGRAASANKIAEANAERADERLEKQWQVQFDSRMKDTVKGPQQKLQYMVMAEKARAQLESYVSSGDVNRIPGAFNNLLHNLTRAQVGGGATLTPEQIRDSTGLLSFEDKAAQKAGIVVNGVPTKAWMENIKQQIEDDNKNEKENIIHIGHQAYESLIDAGVPPPLAFKRVTKSLAATAIGKNDWSKDDAETSGDGVAQSGEAPSEGGDYSHLWGGK